MTPSTRQTLDRAAALQPGRSADILLTLAELEAELGIDGDGTLCAEHQAVALRLAELHLLVDHLVANLRGGHGVPPTPPESAPRKGMRPVTHMQAKPKPAAKDERRGQFNLMHAHPTQRQAAPSAPAAPAAPPSPAREPKRTPRDYEHLRAAGTLGGAALRQKHASRAQHRAAAGLLNAREAAVHCGFSPAGWYGALKAGRVPAPHTDPIHGPGLWHRSSLADVKPRPRNRVHGPATTAPRADGLLTLDQARAATGYSLPGFGLARRVGHVPQPHTYEGPRPLWRPEQLVGVFNRRPSKAETSKANP